jgi:hypothetical protein
LKFGGHDFLLAREAHSASSLQQRQITSLRGRNAIRNPA